MPRAGPIASFRMYRAYRLLQRNEGAKSISTAVASQLRKVRTCSIVILPSPRKVRSLPSLRTKTYGLELMGSDRLVVLVIDDKGATS